MSLQQTVKSWSCQQLSSFLSRKVHSGSPYRIHRFSMASTNISISHFRRHEKERRIVVAILAVAVVGTSHCIFRFLLLSHLLSHHFIISSPNHLHHLHPSMRGKACCVGRGTPSPDGLPSRPVITVSGDLKKSEKPPVLSWSSGFSKPEDAAEFQAIFKNDDADIENCPVPNRLNAVKSILRRHLSRDSGLTKRTLRSSVGNSEAEVARREELRQIRKKRIQDELGDRLEYDDDAKFLCSSPFEPASTRKTGNFSENAQNVSPVIPLSLPRRHSFSTVDKRAASPDRGSDKDRRKGSSIPEMTPSPVLKPQSLSTIDDVCTRRTSWRLSFSSDNRARSLRELSQDYSQSLSKGYSSTALIHTELSFAGTSDMRWLRSQGLRLPSKSTTDENLQRHDDDVRDLGGVDGITEASTTVIPLHEMQISQRLASSGLPSHSSSSPQISISRRSSYSREVSNSDDGFQTINVRRSKYFRGTSGSELNESKISRLRVRS